MTSKLPEKLEHPESDRERAKLYADLALDIAHRSEIARAGTNDRLTRIESHLGIVPPPPRAPSSPDFPLEEGSRPGISSDRARSIAAREIETIEGRRALASQAERRRFLVTVAATVTAAALVAFGGYTARALGERQPAAAHP